MDVAGDVEGQGLDAVTCDPPEHRQILFHVLAMDGPGADHRACLASAGNGETPRPSDTTTRQEFLSCESRKNDLHAETAAILGRHLIDWVPDSDLYDL